LIVRSDTKGEIFIVLRLYSIEEVCSRGEGEMAR